MLSGCPQFHENLGCFPRQRQSRYRAVSFAMYVFTSSADTQTWHPLQNILSWLNDFKIVTWNPILCEISNHLKMHIHTSLTERKQDVCTNVAMQPRHSLSTSGECQRFRIDMSKHRGKMHKHKQSLRERIQFEGNKQHKPRYSFVSLVAKTRNANDDLTLQMCLYSGLTEYSTRRPPTQRPLPLPDHSF